MVKECYGYIQQHKMWVAWIPHTSNVSTVLCRVCSDPARGLYSIPVGCSGEDLSDEFCIAGGEGEDCGWFRSPRESKQRQSMTSDACARRTVLCGSGIEMRATRYLRAPKTEIVYARVKLDEMRTSVVPNEGLSKAKRNMSAECTVEVEPSRE